MVLARKLTSRVLFSREWQELFCRPFVTVDTGFLPVVCFRCKIPNLTFNPNHFKTHSGLIIALLNILHTVQF